MQGKESTPMQVYNAHHRTNQESELIVPLVALCETRRAQMLMPMLNQQGLHNIKKFVESDANPREVSYLMAAMLSFM